MITHHFVTSVMKNSVKIKCGIIVICVASLGVLLMKSATQNEVTMFIPVVFHILSGCGSHLFTKTLGNSDGDISCIPSNDENYISFTKQVNVDKLINKEGKEVNVKRELRLIDSLRSMT